MPVSAKEQHIQNLGRLAIGSLADVRLYRNNVGEIRDSRGIPVRFGLLVGSADTIGIVAPRGRWLSIEWKVPGYKPSGEKELRREAEQQNWRNQINSMGGIAIRCDSVMQGLFGVVLARAGFDLPDGTIYPRELEFAYGPQMIEMAEHWERVKPKEKNR